MRSTWISRRRDHSAVGSAAPRPALTAVYTASKCLLGHALRTRRPQRGGAVIDGESISSLPARLIQRVMDAVLSCGAPRFIAASFLSSGNFLKTFHGVI